MILEHIFFPLIMYRAILLRHRPPCMWNFRWQKRDSREYFEGRHTKTALEDLILRKFSRALDQYSFKAKGSGKSGLISTSRPGPEVMRRTAVEFTEKLLIVRFEVGFPANGRTINAQELEKILLDFLPQIVKKCLYYQAWDKRLVQEGFELADYACSSANSRGASD
mgnify:CR=1 FL=1